MTREELKAWDDANIKKMGHYSTFYTIPEVEGRRERKMNNVTPQYLEVVSELIKEGINFMPFELVVFGRKSHINMFTDIMLPGYNTAIRFYDKDDEQSCAKKQHFYISARRWVYPIFVEKDDPLTLTMEKIHDCMRKSMTKTETGPKLGAAGEWIRPKRARFAIPPSTKKIIQPIRLKNKK